MKKLLVLILSVIAVFTAAISLTACGKVDFTVKFSVDGETYASVSTGGSEVIKMPADPQKDGYTFDGWFWDDGVWARPFTANSLLNEPLKSDMTVYAKFSVNHSHNFNKQVATEPYLKSAATCTAKAVYYYSCECGEKGEQTFEYGDKLPHTYNKQITEEKYLKSKATCTARAVYYYSCECGAASETETFTYGELKDHTFNGTHTCAVCGYYDDTLIKTEILSKNLSVSGNDIKGKVANAQATFSFINDIEVADGATYTVCTDLACTNPVLSKTINLSVGDNVCYILVTNGNDINLYTVTVRRRPIYTVAFNSNGGTSIDSQQVEEDSLATKPADPEKQYYIFTDFEFDFSEPIVNDIKINTLWEPVKFNIYYNLNGGKNNTDNPTTYTIEDSIELNPATKTGYSCKWSDNGAIRKGSVGDRTFTANWQTINYKIYYNLNGGKNNTDNPTTYTIEDRIMLKSASNRWGYTFKSWDNNGVIEKGSTGDKTFTANWQAISYKIYYYLNGGANNIENPVTYTIEDAVELKSAIKLGYSCKWSNNGIIEKGSTGDKTFTASYSVDVKLSSDGTTVIGLNNAVNDLVILPKYNGVKVTSIGEGAFYNCTSLKSITIPDSVTSIGGSAFYGCFSLTSITIPDSVTSIGDSAFYHCYSLTNITIGNSVTSIGRIAFAYCSSLKTIKYTGDINGWVQIDGLDDLMRSNMSLYINGELLTEAVIDTATKIKSCAFYGCSSLTSVTIGNGVTSIGEIAFYNCSSLTSVTIGNCVTSIDWYAFSGCRLLTSITIPDSVTSIGYEAFYNCSSLTSITIPDSVTSIGGSAFYGCFSLTSITIPDSVTSFGDRTFSGCTSLTSVTIGNGVTSIGDFTFSGCTSLTSITIGNSVTSIGNGAFEDCSSLTSINVNDNNEMYKSIDGNLYSKDGKTLIQYAVGSPDTSFTFPDGVTSIGDDAFYNCTSLTSVTIPDSVTSIGDYAFYNCSSLESITIPDGVTSIGSSAFSGCSSLTSITIPDSVTSIGSSAFNGCKSLEFNKYDNGLYLGNRTNEYLALIEPKTQGITSITISDECKLICDLAFYDCTWLTSVTIGNSVTSIGGMAFYRCTSLKRVTIGDSVTSIGSGAFWGCTSLTNVTIGDSVTSIGSSAFSGCSKLTNITIPDSVTSIGNGAFWNCSLLTSITIPDSVTSIGGGAFRGCTSLTSVTIPDGVTSIEREAFSDCTSLTSVTIPDSVTSIGDLAFSECRSLTSIIIPDSVTSICGSAFYYCTSLKTINYKGGKEQWDAISKSSNWDFGTGSYTINYNYVEN